MGINRRTRVGEERTAGVNGRGEGKDGLLDGKVDYIVGLDAKYWVGVAKKIFTICRGVQD